MTLINVLLIPSEDGSFSLPDSHKPKYKGLDKYTTNDYL